MDHMFPIYIYIYRELWWWKLFSGNMKHNQPRFYFWKIWLYVDQNIKFSPGVHQFLLKFGLFKINALKIPSGEQWSVPFGCTSTFKTIKFSWRHLLTWKYPTWASVLISSDLKRNLRFWSSIGIYCRLWGYLHLKYANFELIFAFHQISRTITDIDFTKIPKIVIWRCWSRIEKYHASLLYMHP